MSALRRRTPTPLWRLLTLVVAVGQLLVVGAAWLDVSAGGRDQRTHVESGGTRQHYVHDDANCELCALQHAIARLAPPSPVLPGARLGAGRVANAESAPPARAEGGRHLSRAPPTTA